MPRTLEFFFDYVSPSSYLASTQMAALAARTGAEIRYRPLFLMGVYQATGNTPPIANPAKARYLRRDLVDWCEHLKLPPFRLPDPFPQSSLLANRAGLVADEHGKLEAFTDAFYRRTFVEGLPPSDPAGVAQTLEAVGLNSETILARAEAEEIKGLLKSQHRRSCRSRSVRCSDFFHRREDVRGQRSTVVRRRLSSTGEFAQHRSLRHCLFCRMGAASIDRQGCATHCQ